MEPTETRPTALQVDGGRVAPAAGEMERELFAAIRAKNKERVRELLEMEADVNAYEPVPNDSIRGIIGFWLSFPLVFLCWLAAVGGIMACCELYKDTDKYKKTPLHVAVTTGDSDMVALLLEFGADRNAPATFWNCCCCKKTPTQFVDINRAGSLPVWQRAPIKELLME